ncbi:MAG: glycerophosphodiester phosphodiesterase [Verrucomicrobiota bacterium]
MKFRSKKTFLKLFSPLCAMAISTSASFALEIIAHRGASHDAPENTLASFKLGYEQNADGDELDIHLTKDGKLVLIHDYDTKRTAGVEGKIAEKTFDELRTLDVGQWGDWKGKKFHEKIPTLAEALALIPDGKKFYLEIKCHDGIPAEEKRTITKTLPEMEKVIKRSGKKPKQMPVITFNYLVAKAAKERFPAHDVYWLVGWSKDKKTGEYPNIDDLIAKTKAAKLDGLDLNFGFPVDKDFVKKVHDAGLKLYTWTIDDPAVAKAQIDAGVEGITTNRPEWLREQLKK